MNLAVLMTCYNRKETTLRCLASLLQAMRQVASQDGEKTLHLFLVDDGSSDGTSEAVRKWYEAAQPSVHFNLRLELIPGTGGLFWCRGMALAWRTALKYEQGQLFAADAFSHFLWLNDDVLLDADALQVLLADAETTGNVGAIVGAFLDGRGNMTYGVQENWQWVQPTGAPRVTDGDMSGNLVLIPRPVMDKVGIIADWYTHAYGDYDYSTRMRRAGIKYYLASKICGRCDNDKPDYALEAKSLIERIKCLFKPNGHNWRDAIVYRWKYFGLWRTFLTAVHVPYLVIRGRR